MYAPNGDNAVPFFQGGEHFLGFFLLSVLGPDNQKVENGNNRHKGEKRHQSAAPTSAFAALRSCHKQG
jgi:hypothetical protein